MSAWINDFIKINKYSRPSTKLKEVRKIIAHYTANPGASARNHVKYFGESLIALNEKLAPEDRRYASAHLFIDKIEAICIVPLDEITFAANDIQKRIKGIPYRGIPELLPNANFLSINVELCIEKDGTFHPDTIKRAEQVFAELCKMFNLDPLNDIVRHFDVTAKYCPALWVKDFSQFNNFKDNVNAIVNPPMILPPTWDGIEFKSGQIGRLTILKPINLWTRKDGKLEMVRVLNVGDVFRVYSFDDLHGGQYGLGSNLYVTKMDGYVKYETPSPQLLQQAQDYYKNN